MRRHSSGSRTVLIAAALLTVCAAGLVGTLLWHADAALRREAEAKLAAIGRSVSEPVGRAVEYGIPLQDLPGMAELLRSLASPNPELTYLTVTDRTGRPLHGYGRPPRDFPPAPTQLLGAIRGGRIDMAVPIRADGIVVGAVHLGMADDVALAALPAFLSRFGLSMVAGLALTTALVAAFTRHALDRPLSRLGHALAAAAAGEPPPTAAMQAWGEVAEVADALERLLTHLELRREAFRQDLDELVLAQPDPEIRARMEDLGARGETGR